MLCGQDGAEIRERGFNYDEIFAETWKIINASGGVSSGVRYFDGGRVYFSSGGHGW